MPSVYRYSHHARRAMTHARLLVQQFRHPRMDTGHIFVGVMLTKGSIGWRVLSDMGLDAQQASVYLKSMTMQLDEALASPPHDAALDISLDLAGDESLWLGHHYVGTEHLLLGITRTNLGNASDLMHYLGITSEQVRRRVKAALREGEYEYSLDLARRDAKLSELSRRVINAAEQMAVAQDHETVGVGHLLLILAREHRSVVSILLNSAGLDEGQLEAFIREQDHIATTSIETLLARAGEIAQDWANHYIGTEHLMIALTLDQAGTNLMERLKIEPSVIKRKVESKLRAAR